MSYFKLLHSDGFAPFTFVFIFKADGDGVKILKGN